VGDYEDYFFGDEMTLIPKRWYLSETCCIHCRGILKVEEEEGSSETLCTHLPDYTVSHSSKQHHCSKLLLALASTVLLGFWSRRDL
jgi:hypothetical protein